KTPGEAEKIVDSFRAGFESAFRATKLPAVVGVDLTLSLAEWIVRERRGVADVVEFRSDKGDASRWVVVREAEAFRLLSMEAGDATCLGALDAVKRRQDAQARPWLDWGRELVADPGPGDPLAGPPLARLWTKGASGDIPAAVGCLCATEAPAQAIELLT